ncbi:MAG: heme ABC transporter ATP-binding protein [Acidimicrobiales bacterium]|nr:heme ABC transporter ATP-binding protein [Acidimicrobiales bacterium]
MRIRRRFLGTSDLGTSLPRGTPVVQARRLRLTIRGRVVCDGIDLDVTAGELLVLAGPNGAGKSTLLGALAGDLRPSAGETILFGRPAWRWTPIELARRRALLPQRVSVTFPFTVEQIIRMGRAPWARTPAEDDDDRIVREVLERYEIGHLSGRAYTTLSGGEQARVAMARVDAQRTSLVLLDEPTAALDIRHQQLVLQRARALAADGAAVVVVLHDLNQAGWCADRIALLDEGRVATLGPVNSVLTPGTLSAVYRYPIEVHQRSGTSSPLVIPKVPDRVHPGTRSACATSPQNIQEHYQHTKEHLPI